MLYNSTRLATLLVLCLLAVLPCTRVRAQMPPLPKVNCQEGARVSVAFTGATEISTCTDDDVNSRIRFQVKPFAQAFAYVVVDEAGIIQFIDYSNFINFDVLPAGTLRVYGFSTFGGITASVGEEFSTATLARPCFGLTTNFVTVNNGQSAEVDFTTGDGAREYTFCPQDGLADVVTFSANTNAERVAYLVTGTDGIVTAINTTGSIDFDASTPGVSRVYAYGYFGELDIEVGDRLADFTDRGNCSANPSATFVTVIREDVEGGTVATENGTTEVTTCPLDGRPDLLSFAVAGNTGTSQAYLITDANNVIIRLPEGNTVDLDDAPVGVCRVYSLSYEGELSATIGDVITDTDLATGCNDLSDNFVQVTRIRPVGGTIATTNGQTEVTTCPGDGRDDIVEVAVTGSSGGELLYVLTNRNGRVLATSDAPRFNVDRDGSGTRRIYAVAYRGELNADLTGRIREVEFSPDCFEVSENFVTIIRSNPVGGTIATSNGETELTTCPGDGIDDIFTFVSTGATGGTFAFVVTDADNNIIDLPADGTIDFDDAPPGVCRVWGLVYRGDLVAEVGDNAATDELSTDCYVLSDNFVTVVREDVEGGTVSLADGTTSITTCPQDGRPDVLTFATTGATGSSRALIVTDGDGEVVRLPESNSVDFDEAPVGVCRVYSLSYEGELSIAVGDVITDAELATGCNELSNNFVEVVRTRPVGGTIATTDGQTEVTTCPGDGRDDIVEVAVAGASGGQLLYVLTNRNGRVLATSDEPRFNLDRDGSGTRRIYAVAYRGELNADLTGRIGEVEFSPDCFEVSENFVTIIRSNPVGGTIATSNGETELTTCPGDGIDDIFTFVSTGATGGTFAFVVTDADNNIIDLPADGTIDFDNAPPGVCRVWGLVYRGELVAEMGDNAATDELSTDCYVLSDNFVTVVREDVEGGTIATTDGDTEIGTCPQDGRPDVLTFATTGATGSSQALIVTDSDGVVVRLPEGNSVDFDDAPVGICRVYSLSYEGDLSIAVGDVITDTDLATGCNELSDNFVEVIRTRPVGGTIATSDGQTEVTTCPGDGRDDIVEVAVTGASGGQLLYVLTNGNGRIRATSDAPRFNVDRDGSGPRRIYAVAYRGELNDGLTGPIGEVEFSPDCFEVSENFVTVTRSNPIGGTIATSDGQTELSTCPGDGIDDVFTFVSTGASGGTFAFVVTDADNNIIDLPADGTINFDDADPGVCRVWGLVYRGELVAEMGDNAATDELSTDCYVLSDNFVTVVREDVQGGTVTTTGGDTEIGTCPQDGRPDVLTFATTGATGSSQVLIVTDDNDVVVRLPEGNSVDFDDAPVGVCRVYSFSFEGELSISIGQSLAEPNLATGCNELSDNFVEVIRTRPVGGTIATTDGQTEVTTCPGDGRDDIVEVAVTGASGGQLLYVLTNGNGRVLATSDEPRFNLDRDGSGPRRIYAVAYRGELNDGLTGPIGEVEFSPDCFEVSENFVTITRSNPVGGTIATSDGQTELSTCPGDGIDDVFTFVSTGASGGTFAFVVTDADNNIIDLPADGTINFDDADPGVCRVWGLVYRGDLVAEEGDNAATDELSTDCYVLSDNFVTVVRENIEGGAIATTDGDTEIEICPGDGVADVLQFSTDGNSDGQTVYVVTDANNTVVRLPDGNTVDFDGFPVGVCRVWSLTYLGDLTIEVGATLTDAELATGCSALSENFVAVNRTRPEPGTIATTDGETEVSTCPGDGMADIVEVTVTGAGGGDQLYVLTNAADSILDISETPRFDLDGAGVGTCRIYGLTYRGTPDLTVAGRLNEVAFSDECYALTENFVRVERSVPAGGTVTTADGEVSVSTCPGDGIADPVTFVSDGATGENFTYLVTDENNVIVSLPGSATIDFDLSEPGVCRVWGLAYSGELLAQLGDVVTGDTQLASGCFSLSDDFVTVTREMVSGGTVSIAGRTNTSVTICPNDGAADEISFASEGATGEQFTFVITDNNGEVIAVPPSATIDFEGVPAGTCRVYGVSYVGDLLITRGSDLLTAQLATGCAGLSTNFITVIREDAETGAISTSEGATEVFVCAGDRRSDLIAFDSTGTTLPRFVYLVTDTNNVVIQVPFTDEIDFENFPLGVCRVYGLGYSGVVTARGGERAGIDPLTSGCAALSPNFVTVNKVLPAGGTIATTAGETEVSVCPMDGIADVFSVVTDGTSGPNVAFVVTTNDNQIIRAQESPDFDFDQAEFGICRIYALSYQGELQVTAGEDLLTAELVDGCGDLSDNWITVVRDSVMGGTITLAGGATTASTCPADGTPDLLTFEVSGATGPNLLYVVTDTNNVVRSVTADATQDFDPAGPGVCRVWGLAFAGTATVAEGETLTGDLATGCFMLSDNFVTVIREQPVAGTLAFDGGLTGADICAGDALADSLAITVTGSTGAYAFLVVTDSTVVAVSTGDTLDFDGLASGTYEVYGLAYAGELSVEAGDNFIPGTLATSCSDLTDAPLTVNVTAVEGGTISSGGEATVYLCPENPADGQLSFTTDSELADSNYRYVITTTTDVIITVIDSNAFDFNNVPLQELRVYGISYTGDFLAGPGRSVRLSPLATGCAGVSDNFVLVINVSPEAGTITSPAAETGISCTANGDGTVAVSVTGNSRAGYAILVTDTTNTLLLVARDPAAVDLGSLGEGDYRLYGLSYTGNIVAQPGDDIDVVPLADNCYEVTTDFIPITQAGSIEAGTLTNLTNETDTVTFCEPDGGPQLVIFDNDVSGPNYRFLITDGDGDIIAANLQSNIISFVPFRGNEFRVYGYNYTGNPMVSFGRNVETDALSDSCYAVTTNFIRVVKITPDAGSITVAADSTTEANLEIVIGANNEPQALATFATTSDSTYAFRYVVTDEENVVLAVSDTATIDFGPAGPGVCRVWGVAYDGELLLTPGDTITTAPLATGCADLSDGFVTVTRSQQAGIERDVRQSVSRPFSVNLSAYPNPSLGGGEVTITVESDNLLNDGRITLRDPNGRTHQVAKIPGGSQRGQISFDVSSLAPGVYYIQYLTDRGQQSILYMKQ